MFRPLPSNDEEIAYRYMVKEQEKHQKDWLEGISKSFPHAYQFFKLSDSDESLSIYEQVENWFVEEGYRVRVSVDSHRWTGAWSKIDLDPTVGNSEFYYGTGGRLEGFGVVATVVFKRLNDKYTPREGYDTYLEDISLGAIKRDKMKKFWSSDKGAELRRKSINKRRNG